MATSPERWTRVKAVFEAALAVPADQRAAVLDAAGLADDERAEVLSLLQHHDAATGGAAFLAAAAPPLQPAGAARIGQRLGAWEIVRPLGAGGMGEVFEARRADGQYEGRAAIKLLKRGMDSAAVLQRFALERQALARLNHPHIARLLDAGASDEGLPYFVLEYVEGLPIDEAVRGQPLQARLALFLQLADAVAHAHRNLLVHRDLKPGNVMVDEQGQVKLLDFGIAKALEQGDAGATQMGDRPYTPHYASPEQVRGEPLSTATDVYSLGVLLAVMLTGQRPYARGVSSASEVAQRVLAEPARRPSADGDRALRGDLDNIVLKALQKDVAQRYPSVDALAADVRAHLAGYPVSARPPSAGYLLSRFVQRNRAAVGAAGVALFAVVAGAGTALWQAHVADAQRDLAQQRFRQVRHLANQLVFKYHDQIENLPGATKARDALLADAATFLDGLAGDGADDPQLAYELAATYYRISRLQGVGKTINTGQHALAEANLAKAIALARRYSDRPGMSTEALAVSVNMQVSQAELLQRRGELAKAEAVLRDARTELERHLAGKQRDAWLLTSAISLNGVLARLQGTGLANPSLGHWADACDSARRAVQAAYDTLAADPLNNFGPDSLAYALNELTGCEILAGRLDEAQALLRRMVPIRDLMVARYADDMDFRYLRAASRTLLAQVLALRGEHNAAATLQAEALALAREAVARDAGNRAAAPLLRTLETGALALRVLAGDLATAQRDADGLLARWPQPEPGFADARARAEALVWAARAWRSADARRARALAAQAAALMAGSDDNAARRAWLAQALGEVALARAAPDDAVAEAAARDALAAWSGAPPQLDRWKAPLQAILQAAAR